MKQVNIYEAKTMFSRLVAEALKGEDVVIARHGKPLIRFVPVEQREASDAFGMDRGKIWIAADFDEPLDEFGEYAREARVR